MPWKIYSYILRELLKVLLLATAVLVVVIGFALAIKPMSDGLLSAGGMVKFVLYSMPTVLGFALPFAAAFAGTMVFCRLAADNEILACRASGMSYLDILMPVLVLGIALTVGIFYLSNWVVPRFYLLAQQQVESDMISLLVRQVHKRQTLKLPGMPVILYADAADDTQPPPKIPGDTQPTRMLLLRGVAVGILNENGVLVSEGTAENATAFLFRIDNKTVITVVLKNAMHYDAESQEFTAVQESGPVPPQPLPNPFKDRLTFLSLRDLLKLGKAPERFDLVREKKAALQEAISVERMLGKMEQALFAGQELTLAAPGETYRVTAPRIERVKDGIKLSGSGRTPLRVATYVNGRADRRFDAAAGVLEVEVDKLDGEPRAKIELEKVTVFDARSPSRFERKEHTLPRGMWAGEPLEPMTRKSTKELTAIARVDYKGAAQVQAAADSLVAAEARLGRKIIAKLHERAASAVGCLLVLCFAVVLSMQMRGSTTLAVYFWSFLLATLVVVITYSGENIAGASLRHRSWMGYPVIWAGDVLILVVGIVAYARLARN